MPLVSVQLNLLRVSTNEGRWRTKITVVKRTSHENGAPCITYFGLPRTKIAGRVSGMVDRQISDALLHSTIL